MDIEKLVGELEGIANAIKPVHGDSSG